MNTSLLLIIITTALVNNVVLSQFLGICSFLGVSKQIKTSLSLGVAVIFVITLSSGVASLLYDFLLVPLHLEYLETIVFILVIACLVQIVEMFLKRTLSGHLQCTRYLPATDHDQLCCARCRTHQRARWLQFHPECYRRLWYCNRLHDLDRTACRYPGPHR